MLFYFKRECDYLLLGRRTLTCYYLTSRNLIRKCSSSCFDLPQDSWGFLRGSTFGVSNRARPPAHTARVCMRLAPFRLLTTATCPASYRLALRSRVLGASAGLAPAPMRPPTLPIIRGSEDRGSALGARPTRTRFAHRIPSLAWDVVVVGDTRVGNKIMAPARP